MGKSWPRTFRRTCADRGSAIDRRTRTGNQSIRSQRILDDPRASASRRAANFTAKLWRHKDEEIEINNEAQATAILDELQKAKWQVAEVVQKEKRRNAAPPFTTSKLQQASYNRLRYTAKRTMGIAQKLYEGVELGDEGSIALITYMRTDSVRVSNDALEQVRTLIPELYGAESCRKNQISIRAKKTRKMPTKQFVRQTPRGLRIPSADFWTTNHSSSIN